MITLVFAIQAANMPAQVFSAGIISGNQVKAL
jgi:hypothetical protein